MIHLKFTIFRDFAIIYNRNRRSNDITTSGVLRVDKFIISACVLFMIEIENILSIVCYSPEIRRNGYYLIYFI